jgi:hypothetical protein
LLLDVLDSIGDPELDERVGIACVYVNDAIHARVPNRRILHPWRPHIDSAPVFGLWKISPFDACE